MITSSCALLPGPLRFVLSATPQAANARAAVVPTAYYRTDIFQEVELVHTPGAIDDYDDEAAFSTFCRTRQIDLRAPSQTSSRTIPVPASADAISTPKRLPA